MLAWETNIEEIDQDTKGCKIKLAVRPPILKFVFLGLWPSYGLLSVKLVPYLKGPPPQTPWECQESCPAMVPLLQT